MASTHPKIIYEVEMDQFVCEKVELGGSIPKGTLTTSSGFVATKLAVYNRKGILG